MQRKGAILAIVVLGLVLVGLAGRCVYGIVCISCNYPPLKKYNYFGSVAQFTSAMQKVQAANFNISVKVSRRDSADIDNGSRDMLVKIKKDSIAIYYELVCKQNTGANKSKIELVSAHNEKHTYGGYRIEDFGVKDLLGEFENFQKKIEKEQHVVLKVQ